MFSKESVRDSMKMQRRALSKEAVEGASFACCNLLFQIPEYQMADTILVYISQDNEVSTRPIIEDAIMKNKIVAAPVCVNDEEMEFYQFFDYSDLKPGKFGIMEPPRDILIEPEDDIVLVPGIAFDVRKNRIGYGAGYYDRYLEQHKELYKIGLAYDFQVVDAISEEDFDVKQDILITNQQVFL